MVEMRGFFSLSYRCSPFRGFVVDPNWDQPWRDHMVDEIEMQAWMGTGVTYGHRNETRPGNTIVRAYAVNSVTQTMLMTVPCMNDWQPPQPEDLALYDWNGRIVCYTISRECEVYLRRDLSLSNFASTIDGRRNVDEQRVADEALDQPF